MAYEPLIRDSNGSGDVAFRIPSTTEENYLAYQMGLYLADSANIPDALVTTNATNGTAIGSHSNTYYNSILGQHGFTAEEITTETIALYQKNSILDETNADVRRVISRKSYSAEDRVDDITANLSQVNLLRNRVKADYAQILSVSGDDLTIKIPSDRNLTFDRFVGQSINQHDSGVNGFATLAGTVEFGNALHEPPKMTVEAAVGVTTGRYEDSDNAYVINFRNATIGGTAYSSAEAKSEYEVGDNGIYANALTQQNFQTIINEFDSDDMDGLTTRLLSRAFTSDYPGTMRLAVSAPSSDYTFVEEAFRDTRANNDSDVNIYNLYKRTSMSAPDTIRPFHIKRSSGRTGTYQGIQASTDTQIKESFGARARHLISANNSSVGAYQLRTAIQGPPTDPGTWVAKGNASDTTNTATERNYTRNCQVTRFTNFTGTFIGDYIGTFLEVLNYTGDFVRDFTGNFTGNFISDTGTYETNYAGNYTADYIEGYIGTFTETFTGNYSRDYQGNFLGTDYTGNFARDFTGEFILNYTGNFIDDLALAGNQVEPTGQTLPQRGNPLMTLTSEIHSRQRHPWRGNITAAGREALQIPDLGLVSNRDVYNTNGTTTHTDRKGAWCWPQTGNYNGSPHSVLFSIRAERESGGGAYVGCTIEFDDDPRCNETFRVHFKADNADWSVGTYYYSITGAASGNINVNPGLYGYASVEVEFVPGAGNTVTFYNQVRRDGGESVSMAFIVIMTGEENTNNIPIDYTRDTGGEFTRASTNSFTGEYLGTFLKDDYTVTYTGPSPINPDAAYDYIGNFITSISTTTFGGDYVGTYTGDFSGAYLRNSVQSFTTTYTRIFTETYTTTSIIDRDSASFEREYIFDTYLADYVNTYTGTFTGPADYTDDFTNVFIDNFTDDFTLINTEDTNILENYEGTFAGNFVGDFTGDFSALELTGPSQTINTYTLYVRVA